MTGLITIPEAAKLLGYKNPRAAQREVSHTKKEERKAGIKDSNGTLAGIRVVQINGRNRVSAEAIQKLLKGEAA